MKNEKSIGMKGQIAAQNAETPRNPNQSGPKISGNQKNVNTTGDNGSGGGYRNNPNTSGVKDYL